MLILLMKCNQRNERKDNYGFFIDQRAAAAQKNGSSVC